MGVDCELQGVRMTLEEIESFRRSLKVCPKCGSREGFWFTIKPEGGYGQCKHCGAVLEACEVYSLGGEDKKSAQGKREILRRRLRL